MSSLKPLGSRGIRKRTVGHLKTALRQRLGKSATDRQVHRDEAGGREVRIEAGKQLEIEAAIGGEIEGASAGELHRTVSGEISSLPQQWSCWMLIDSIGEDEANGILIMELHIFHVEGDCSQVAVRGSIARGWKSGP